MIRGRVTHDPNRKTSVFRLEDGDKAIAFARPDGLSPTRSREYVLIPLDVLPEVVEEEDNFAIIRPVHPDDDGDRVPTDPRGWVELVPKVNPWVHHEEMILHDRVALLLAREAYNAREARKAEHEATLAVIRAATLPDELPPVDDVVSALRSLGYNVTAGPWND